MKTEIKKDEISQHFLGIIPFVCACMVIGLHTYSIPSTGIAVEAIIEGFFSHGIFMAAVPSFFIISGYLFFHNAYSIDEVFRKQKRRLTSLVLPFVAWSSLYFFIFAVAGNVISISRPVDVSIMGIIRGILFYEYVFPMWYMFVLCVFMLATPIIYKVINANQAIRILVLGFVALLGVLNIQLRIYIDEMERTIFPFNYFFYFLTGSIVTKVDKQKIKALAKKIPPVCSLMGWIIFGFVGSLLFDERIPVFNHRIAVPFITLAFLLFALNIVQKLKWGGYRTRIVNRIPTMVMYGIHPLVGMILIHIIPKNIPILPAYFIRMIINVLISSCTAIIVKKINPLCYCLNGNR